MNWHESEPVQPSWISLGACIQGSLKTWNLARLKGIGTLLATYFMKYTLLPELGD